ncbi:unconventional myosin-IXb isoform X1, partial [Lates japonicus]
EEYQAEGITWHNIDYTDNVGCIHLISKKPTGLLYLLDEESNFPHATDETLLAKFKQQHQGNKYFVPTPVMEPAFVIRHFAGKVKYQIKDFREKNTDHMRPDIVALLRSSDRAYVRQLIGMDPVAMFRWGILRATIRGIAAFNEAGRSWAAKTSGVVRPISRTPLGELQRSNAPIERMYKRASMLDFYFDHLEERPLEAFEDIFDSYESKKKNKTTKQKQVIPKSLLDSRSLKLIVSLTLHDRTTKSLLHLHKKKKPLSISAQFQTSLTKLLETLNRAEPFFIRCIRSNAEKKEMYLDEALVVQQLRYTGMLETVRIRRSGYGAKYTFQEFIEQFRVLLPKTATACKEDISVLLDKKMGLDPTTYQIGKTKVFLKELERQQLQDTLHKDVIHKIIFLQRWFRACLQRKEFMDMRQAAILIQRSWRRYCKEERRQHAAILIQAVWRGHRQRLEYHRQRQGATKIQALVRGHSARRRCQSIPIGKDQTSPPKSKSQESSKLKERSDSKELDQYTFVAWKMKEDKGGKKEAKTSPPPPASGPVRPSTLSLQPADSAPERNGLGEGGGAVNLHRRPGAIKEKPEKWRGRRSDGEYSESNSPPPPHNREERRKKQPLSETASSSIDSLSPGSEGAGAVSARELISPSDSHGDGSKGSSFRRRQQEGSGHPDSAHSIPSTPDRPGGFFSKILKKRPHKEAQTPDNGELTLAQILNERPTGGEAPTSGHPSRPLSQPHSDRKGVGRNPSIKISRATRVSEQWNASLDREITNANELRHLDEFLGNQVNDFRSRGKSLSATEAIFVTATMQFRENIKAMYSLTKPTIGYKALMTSYQNKVIHLASDKQKGEVQLVVNLFQSVLDGFIRGEMKKEEAEPAKPAKARKKRRKKDKSMESPLDHVFVNYQVNIMQSCDQCSSYIWGMEKAYMCSYCKMVCHKKCICKITTDCSTFCAKKSDEDSGGQHFGVRVCHLVSDKNPVPMVLEMMLEHVEMHGLYTEGIYRKSGSANRIKELHQRLETDPHLVCLEDYPIHTVTGLVKQWLRELPDPLMTFTHYNDFLHAVELPEKQEQLHAIYKTLEELPTANFNTLERLVFHLVRVCKEEAHNRMSPNSLAIVFAPCILRCPDSADPLLSMKDVAKTTTCLEMLINEQIRRYNEKMEEIEQLEYAEALAVNQLKLKRQNTHYWHLPLRFSAPYKGVVVHEKVSSDLSVVPENEPLDSDTEAEKNLVERIKSIKQEKEDLACRLPEMEQPGSDQENLDSEASLSSESLLDEQQRSSAHSSEPEGRGGSQLKRFRPVCPPKPPDLAQRPKILIGRVSLSNLTPASSTSSMSSCASSTSESSSASLRHLLQRRNPVIPDTVKLPPGMLSQSAASSMAQTYTPPVNRAFKNVVRRREQPGRRKDSTQSLYIDSPECNLLLHFSSCPPSASSSSSSISLVTRSPQELHHDTRAPKDQRRFSDPDIPYAEEDV